MSIDKLPSGLWRARYPGFPSKAFPRKGEAQDYEDSCKEVRRNGKVNMTAAGKRTLAELAAEHMNAIAGELTTKTLRTYRDLWSAHVDARILGNPERTWAHKLADTQLRSITPKAVEEWKADRLKAGAGKQSIRKTMALMQSMFDRALRDEAVASNPVKLVKKPSGKTDGSALVVTPEAVEKIRAQLDDTGKTLVSLLAQTGMRPGEARALRWEHIGAQSIRVEHGCDPDGTAKPTKTEHQRTVPLTPTLKADLKAWRKAQGNPPDSAQVFPRTSQRRTTGGGPCWSETDWSNWQRRVFGKAVADSGVSIGRPYELRHSIASLWLLEGQNPLQVAAWLGHKPSETLGTYGKVIADLDQTDRTPAAEHIAEARKSATKPKRRRRTAAKASAPKPARAVTHS